MKNILKLKYPAAWWGARWRDALPAGNGRIGAAVYGGVYEETVMLTHEDLWWLSRTPRLPEVSDRLPKLRELLLQNRPWEANSILSDALKEKYSPELPRLGCPLPLGDLKLTMPGKKAFKDYSRSLNMESGEISVSWKDCDTRYTRQLFVSRPQDLIVYEINAEGPDKITAALYLDLHDRTDLRAPFDFSEKKLPEHLETEADEGYLFYAARNDDGTDFGAVARVVSRGGRTQNEDDKIRFSGAEQVLVMLKVFIKGERQLDWSRLKTELSVLPASYGKLLEPHVREHGALFKTMSLDLNAPDRELSNEELLLQAYQGQAPLAMAEKMWAYGRYLLISSSREKGHPCPLMGLWCGEYIGFWAFNMANENLQMIYWQALSGNMPELLLAVFDYYEDKLEDFRFNAKRIYGCRGIFIPAPTTPESGLCKDLQPHILHWTGGAGWIAQHYYDYYLYTGDVRFLRQRALPFLRETALFYEDFFIVGEDGYFISCPSNSPENSPGNYEGLSTAINATLDFAIAKEVLTHLVQGATTVGFYNEDIPRWETMLKRIPQYQINEDGAVREWMHPFFEENYHHRHQSHLYPIFPGTEVTRENDPKLFEAFVTAVKKRLFIGLKEQSGWSLAHMANIYARTGEGDLALECLDILARSCVINNFYTCHNDWRGMGIGVDMDWAPFQIDANMGWTAAVQEMLVFSLPGKITLLPALPTRWRKGQAGPLLTRGGVEVLLQWDREKGQAEAELLSKSREQTVEMLLPGGKREKIMLGKNKKTNLKFSI